MCDICHSHTCPPACPSYRGNLPNFTPVVGHCMLCDGFLRADEPYLERGDQRLCAACAASLELDDILLLSGVESAAELLLECSAWRKTF